MGKLKVPATKRVKSKHALQQEKLLKTLKAVQLKHRTLEDAIAALERPRTGRPGEWGVNELGDVYGGVEAIRAQGFGYTTACRHYARFAGLTATVVSKRYDEAKKKWSVVVADDVPGYLRIHLARRHDLQAFVACLGQPPRSR